MKLSLLLCVVSAVHGYMYLNGASVASGANAGALTDGPLRGEKPGNVWNPPKAGGNRIPCGGKGNTKYINTRLSLLAGSDLRIVGKLTLPQDDGTLGENTYDQPWVDVQIKYGARPNFQMTQGFSMGVFAPKASGNFQLIRRVETQAYNGDATVQVAYHVSEERAFYQCIDITISGGQPAKIGDFPWGVGPDDKHVPIPNCIGENCGVDGGETSGFVTALIIILILIAIIAVALAYYCMVVKKFQVELDKDKPAADPLEVENPPAEPVKPLEPTPPQPTPPKEDSDNEPVGHVMYTPAEDSDPTPQESSEQKSLDATGSQGRHFHFRYVEEDDDDGAREDVV